MLVRCYAMLSNCGATRMLSTSLLNHNTQGVLFAELLKFFMRAIRAKI